MNRFTLAPLALCMLAAPFAARAEISPYPSVLWEPDQVMLDAGETATILHAKTEQHYRICLEAGAHNLPLTVLDDGSADTVVQPGSCADLEGKNLRVRASEQVPPGEPLVVHYSRVG